MPPQYKVCSPRTSCRWPLFYHGGYLFTQFLRPYLAAITVILLALLVSPSLLAQRQTPDKIYTLADEKRARTPAQKKIDSQLLYAIKQRRGETRGVPELRIELKLDDQKRVLVDITSLTPSKVIAPVKELGGSVISVSQRYHTLRALLPLDKLELLASAKQVRFISLPAEPATHGAVITH